ncbi:MAG: nucleotidyl transferase AbiEii/AbiGii toxin family protein [Pseudomonadota bacterium]
MKGGTSLSKRFGLIDRFSEDIDIQIHPNNTVVKTGKNHDKLAHIASRRQFFDDVTTTLTVPDLKFQRDDSLGDLKYDTLLDGRYYHTSNLEFTGNLCVHVKLICKISYICYY